MSASAFSEDRRRLNFSEVIREHNRKSAWSCCFESVTDSNFRIRMSLEFIAERLKSANDLDRTEYQCSIVIGFLSKIEAPRGLFDTCKTSKKSR